MHRAAKSYEFLKEQQLEHCLDHLQTDIKNMRDRLAQMKPAKTWQTIY